MSRIQSENADNPRKRMFAKARWAYGGRSRLIVRLTVVVLAFLFVISCGLHFYMRYRMGQALSLLSEAKSIKTGDGEQSVISLAARYGGTKFPLSSFSEGKCATNDTCQNDKLELHTYSYEIRLSPFHVFSLKSGQTAPFLSAFAFLLIHGPNYLREPLGLRNWLIAVVFRVQDGHVTTVRGNAFVEGRSGWLGNSWMRSSEKFGHDVAPGTLSIQMAFLTLAADGGSTLEETLSPLASVEQVKASYEVNDRCFTGLIPCASLCEFKPSVFRYLNAHPEVSVDFDTDGCKPGASHD